MVLLSGKKGFKFPVGYFDASFKENAGQEVTTERILAGIDKVDGILIEKGFYDLVKSESKFYISE